MKDLRNMNKEQLIDIMTSIGEKPFRGKQLYEWVSKGAMSFEEMTNMSSGLRQKLSEKFLIDNYRIVEHHKAKDGTIKALGVLADGNIVESVFMTYKHGHSA